MNKTKTNLFTVLLFLFASGFLTACTYDKAPEIDPVISTVSYKNEIQPIMATHCYSCHSSLATDPERPGYAFFDDFNELKRYALKPSTVNAELTTLQARLRQIEFPGMPFKKDPLPESEIQLIEKWIKAGAPNN